LEWDLNLRPSNLGSTIYY